MKSIAQAMSPHRGMVRFIRTPLDHPPHGIRVQGVKSDRQSGLRLRTCKTISPLPIQSTEQASKLGKDGENVTCPTCHMIMKVIVCASRKDLYAFPVVTLQTHGVVETVR